MNANMPNVAAGLTGLLLVVGLVAGCEPNEPARSTQARSTQARSTQTSATAQPSSAGQPSAAPQPAAAGAHDDRYEARSPEGPVVVGQKQKVELAITPGDGLKINKEFPWKFEFSAPEGVQLAQKRVKGAQIDLAESQATIALHLEANTAGDHSLDATGDFSVCNDTKCWVIRDQPVSFNLRADANKADPEKADPDEAGAPPQ